MTEAANLSLVVRRTVRAPVERVFDAWTKSEFLKRWWGPEGVTCPEADVDLRVGGHYRIANKLPDGNIVVIHGEFELIEPPTKLVYSWRVDPGIPAPSRVTVRFETHAEGTEVIVIHERIASDAIRDNHEQGWNGCLDGLIAFADEESSGR
ncbi:MAG: SRPBCC domain-containing protein [Deltaproteobacteria bacterium]|nr:SRPBCC domain-containing protein [Deltaproteobacteria bacterium]